MTIELGITKTRGGKYRVLTHTGAGGQYGGTFETLEAAREAREMLYKTFGRRKKRTDADKLERLKQRLQEEQ